MRRITTVELVYDGDPGWNIRLEPAEVNTVQTPEQDRMESSLETMPELESEEDIPEPDPSEEYGQDEENWEDPEEEGPPEDEEPPFDGPPDDIPDDVP